MSHYKARKGSDSVQWIHLTDLQLGRGPAEGNDNDACAQRLIEQVLREEPDFVINWVRV